MNAREISAITGGMRKDIVRMTSLAASGHPGGSLSCLDALATLFFYKMKIDVKNPKWDERDRFVLSKGHASPAYYAVLAKCGFFAEKELEGFRKMDCMLQGHPDAKRIPGVDASTGSLGQGASIAVGMALGAKAAKKDVKVYAVLGDGELQEGQIWEASMSAAHYKLDNLTFLVDNNGLQIDGKNDNVMSLGNIAQKFAAFGFETIEIDGHNIQAIMDALDQAVIGKPKCIVMKTIKGKGVSFMENQAGWHGKAPSAAECETAINELSAKEEGAK